MKKLERESDTCATVVLRCAAIAGKPGKYISIEKGPMADKTPRIRISLYLLDIRLKYMLIIHVILYNPLLTFCEGLYRLQECFIVYVGNQFWSVMISDMVSVHNPKDEYFVSHSVRYFR